MPGYLPGQPIDRLPGTSALVSATPSFSNPFLAATSGRYNETAARSFVAPETTRGDPNARSLYDRNQYIWTLPEATRLSAAMQIEFPATPDLMIFGDASGGRNRSRTEYHPRESSGIVPRSNPYNPFGVDVTVDWRIPDAERRRTITEDDYFAGLIGLRNRNPRSLRWETAASYSRDEYIDTTSGLYLASAVQSALASTNPNTALNPFGGRDYRQPQAIFDAIATNTWFGGEADLLVFDAQVGGQLMQLPAGPVDAVMFAEHRRESFTAVSDIESRRGNIMGTGTTGADLSARRHVSALAAEIQIPLLSSHSGESGNPRLSLEAAARAEKFSRSFNSGIKPSVGIMMRPWQNLAFRGSHSRTFRAPTLPQLYAPQSDTFYNDVPDPRRPPALSGDDNDGPNMPRLVRQGGNPALGPETGRVSQVGVIWSPRSLPKLRFESTWFRYEMNNMISGVSPTYVLENELGGLGALVHRDPAAQTVINRTSLPVNVVSGPFAQTTAVGPGQTTTLPGRIMRVDVYTVNLSHRRLEGWDFGGRHEQKFAGATWLAAASATYTHFLGSAYDDRTPMINIVGMSNIPRWRGQASLDWKKDAWSAGTTFNYQARSGHHRPDAFYQKPYRVVHVRVSYTSPRDSWLSGTQIQVGIDDLFDEDPPLNLDHPIGFNYAMIPRPQGRFWRVALRRTW